MGYFQTARFSLKRLILWTQVCYDKLNSSLLFGGGKGGPGGHLLFREGRDGGEVKGTSGKEGKKGVPSKKYGGYTSLTTTRFDFIGVISTSLSSHRRVFQKSAMSW